MDRQKILPICSKIVGLKEQDMEWLEYILYLKEEEERENVYLDDRKKVFAFIELFVKLGIGEIIQANQDNFIEYRLTADGMELLSLICNTIKYVFRGLAVHDLKKAESLAVFWYLLEKGKRADVSVEELRDLYHDTEDKLVPFSKLHRKLVVACKDLEEIGVILTLSPRRTSQTSKVTYIDFQIIY